MARYGKGGTRKGNADAPPAHRAAKNAAQALAAAVALAAVGLVTGCAAANAVPVPCAPVVLSNPAQIAPSKPGDVLLDGLLDCQYANGLMSNCVLIAGATLDDLANAELRGTMVTRMIDFAREILSTLAERPFLSSVRPNLKHGARMSLALCKECGTVRAFNIGKNWSFPDTGYWTECRACGTYRFFFRIDRGRVVNRSRGNEAPGGKPE